MLCPKRLLQYHDLPLSNLAHFRILMECHLAIKMGATRGMAEGKDEGFSEGASLGIEDGNSEG